MLSFSLVAEALTGLIYHRPSGENSKFLPSVHGEGRKFGALARPPYLPDREASLIKKEYCRLSASPHSLQVTPIQSQSLPVKGGQANRCPSLGPWGSASLRANKPPLHCGGTPSHWRPSLVASLHSEGNQVLEQMVGPSVHESRGGGYLAPGRRVARVTTTWAHASAPRWGETWVRSIKIPRFLAALGGWAYSPRLPWHVPRGPWVWSLGLFSSIFFSTSINKKKMIKKEYCRRGPTPHK